MVNHSFPMKMTTFVWSIVKCLPAPLLMALSIIGGMVGLWLLAQANPWVVVGLIVAIILVFIVSVCNSAKGN
jgi:membrane protein YdbS with pleckstrin-like domain